MPNIKKQIRDITKKLKKIYPDYRIKYDNQLTLNYSYASTENIDGTPLVLFTYINGDNETLFFNFID